MVRRTVILAAAITAGGGCVAPRPTTAPAQQEEALRLLLPQRIEIVGPFTRVRSFDEDDMPDGIELLLQAVNSLDDPGLMLVGDVRVELYEFVPASADHKGRRLECWTVELDTPQKQRTYWNDVTQMYEFRLGIDPSRIPPAERFVLAVTYTSP
ncbi:MAG: hypothetical protein D6788_01340, partial [Planctomycetota bacterium]